MSERFRSPFDAPSPEGADGWRDLYSYSSLFGEGRRAHDDERFWFQDGVHWPEVLAPWDATLAEYAIASLSQYNCRHLRVPPSDGIAFRILNGYLYLSPVAAPADEITERIADFIERAGHYYENWDELYSGWMLKVKDLIAQLSALDFGPLPVVEDVDTVVKSGAGVGSGYRLVQSYQTLLDLALRLWQYHFEFLNLGYAAYLDFFGFCKQVWPSIPELAIATMVAGVEVDLFRPDEELRSLARRAVASDLVGTLRSGAAEQVWGDLARSPEGREWLAAYEESAEPWFNFSTGSGFYHSDRIWIESKDVPLSFIRGYLDRIERGEDIDRPIEAIAEERQRIVSEYAELLATVELQDAFTAKLGLARTVFPYVENHNFYVEHWGQSVIWRQMRRLGGLLAAEGYWATPDDIFYLKRGEVAEAIWDYYVSWATPAPAAGPHHWPAIVAERRRIVTALRAAKPLPALGRPPASVTEPFTVMLWGITEESIAGWLGNRTTTPGAIEGFAASPGIAEGRARVIVSADQIGEVQDGEVLVAPLTAPSWAPLFGRLAATVTDTGGMMSHAAIVCREYGLPAVTGTGHATTTLRTGMRVRVDGGRGTVTILDD